MPTIIYGSDASCSCSCSCSLCAGLAPKYARAPPSPSRAASSCEGVSRCTPCWTCRSCSLMSASQIYRLTPPSWTRSVWACPGWPFHPPSSSSSQQCRLLLSAPSVCCTISNASDIHACTPSASWCSWGSSSPVRRSPACSGICTHRRPSLYVLPLVLQ